jgi:hypothetical protein
MQVFVATFFLAASAIRVRSIEKVRELDADITDFIIYVFVYARNHR